MSEVPPNCFVTGQPSLPDHRCTCTHCREWRRKCEGEATRFRTPPSADALVALLTTTGGRGDRLMPAEEAWAEGG